MAKHLAWRHLDRQPDYLAGYFIQGRIIRPPSRFHRKLLRTQLGVTQKPGWIIGQRFHLRAKLSSLLLAR
jgi:hypothetical protein